MKTIALLLAAGAAGGLIRGGLGYLKKRKENEPFSWKKFGISCLEGLLGGLASYVPVVGAALSGAGAASLADKIHKPK